MDPISTAKPSEVFYHLPDHKRALHLGGHYGLEGPMYNYVLFVEPQPEYAEYIRSHGFDVIEGAIGCSEIYITTYEQGSSALKPKEHIIKDIIKVKSYRLDDIEDGFDLLVMDIQGFELEALKTSSLKYNHIILEASENPRYIGAPTKKEIVDYLFDKGFEVKKEFRHGSNDIYDIIFYNR